MHALSAEELIGLREWGQGKSAPRRALGLLAAAFPEIDAEEIAAWDVGRRDRALLAMRQSLFGPTLDGLANCPSCGEAVELSLDVPRLLGEAPADEDGEQVVQVGAVRVRCACPIAARCWNWREPAMSPRPALACSAVRSWRPGAATSGLKPGRSRSRPWPS